MAELRVCALSTATGPSIPSPLRASLGQREWPGGGVTQMLVIHLGYDSVEVWPADRERVRELYESLGRVLQQLERA